MNAVADVEREISSSLAYMLNSGCACRSLDPDKLRSQLDADPALAGLHDAIAATRPHLFSHTAVFVSAQQYRRIAAVIAAVERVAAQPAYQATTLARAPAIAASDPGPRGAFMGYDFHLGESGPQLIEINTNAGGALLNAALARAQQACCRGLEPLYQPAQDLARFDQTVWDMFAGEWRRQRGDARLARIAIVDDAPTTQYLFPEFRLFERLFRRFGIEATVVDAADLTWRDGRLWDGDAALDMVYNRLTDFYLDQPAHAALRHAYEAGAVVLTPHPHAHALYADKRNLATLTDPVLLTRLGADTASCATLAAGIPHTETVTATRADDLWAQRRRLFFKPASGYGSKAAYRGDKLTRRVWDTILAGDYVAQALVQPSERLVRIGDADIDLKLDVRAYVYDGTIQLLAARLYEGQTTNFRTAGGGFAPVFLAAREEIGEAGWRAPERPLTTPAASD